MVAGAIRVCVLEGIYTKMTELGLPLSLAVELQYRGLRLDSSLWTVRLSNGGYSACELIAVEDSDPKESLPPATVQWKTPGPLTLKAQPNKPVQVLP